MSKEILLSNALFSNRTQNNKGLVGHCARQEWTVSDVETVYREHCSIPIGKFLNFIYIFIDYHDNFEARQLTGGRHP